MSNNTAEKIVNSMYELIAEVGYEKASINNICKRVGVHKGSFYYFFESKEQVLMEIVKFSYVSDYKEDLAKMKAISDVSEYKKALLQTAYAIIYTYEDNDDWRKVCAEIDLQSERIPEIKKIIDESNQNTLDCIKEYLQHGVTIGAFERDFNVTENADILYTTYLGLDVAILYDIPLNAKNVITKIIERMFI